MDGFECDIIFRKFKGYDYTEKHRVRLASK